MLFLIIIKSLLVWWSSGGRERKGRPTTQQRVRDKFAFIDELNASLSPVLVALPLPMGVNPFAYEIIAHVTTRFQRCTQHRPFYPDRMAKKLRLSFVSIFAFLLFHYHGKGATNSISFVAPSLLRDSTLKSRKKRPAAASTSTLEEREKLVAKVTRDLCIRSLHPSTSVSKETWASSSSVVKKKGDDYLFAGLFCDYFWTITTTTIPVLSVYAVLSTPIIKRDLIRRNPFRPPERIFAPTYPTRIKVVFMALRVVRSLLVC